ncbi:carbon-nitrogen hydrolase family protein [soil metagenome]
MKIAAVQAHVSFNDPVANSKFAIETISELASQGVNFIVFPEAFLTGYCVDSSEEAHKISINRDHPAITDIEVACSRHDVLAVVGFAERDKHSVKNTAVLFEPGVENRFYSKAHLPLLGLDRFVEAGTELPIFETRYGSIGILICFDLRPPEATRTLALKGARLIVLPTNWPVGAEVSAETICIARAAENRIFLVTCDRVGEENGFTFIGKSKIIAPTGKVFSSAEDQATILIAEIDLLEAEQKTIINIPGKYETEVFASRKPHLYSVITEQIPAAESSDTREVSRA